MTGLKFYADLFKFDQRLLKLILLFGFHHGQHIRPFFRLNCFLNLSDLILNSSVLKNTHGFSLDVLMSLCVHKQKLQDNNHGRGPWLRGHRTNTEDIDLCVCVYPVWCRCIIRVMNPAPSQLCSDMFDISRHLEEPHLSVAPSLSQYASVEVWTGCISAEAGQSSVDAWRSSFFEFNLRDYLTKVKVKDLSKRSPMRHELHIFIWTDKYRWIKMEVIKPSEAECVNMLTWQSHQSVAASLACF